MSVQTALDNLHRRHSNRWAHTEYSMEYNHRYLSRMTGKRDSDPDFLSDLYTHWDYDLLWHTDDGLRGDWAQWGRFTDMGHAEYAIDGVDKRQPKPSPFTKPEQVWDFDAVQEYGLPDFEEQVSAYESTVQKAHRDYPHQLTTGGYYKSIVSGAIQAFGWEMLLLAAAEPDKMERVLESFFQRTLFHIRAWCETSVEVVIQHDDIVWASGPFMFPDIYRRIIFPLYAELWKPLHAAGKTVIFTSDGDFTQFAGDIAEAGADALCFEPCNDFGFMVDNFGKTHCLIGSYVDCRDLTLGRWAKVRRDLDATFEKLTDCRGAIVGVGNQLPPNIPDEMLDLYFSHLQKNLVR